MKGKTFITRILVILLILVAITALIVFQKNELGLDYTELTYMKAETTIRIGVPKNSGFVEKKIESQGNIVEFTNAEYGYKILASLFDRSYEMFEAQKKAMEEEENYSEITIKKFKGYTYNSSTSSRIIVLSLGQASNGLHRICQINIERIRDLDKPIEEIMDLKEIKRFLKSIKVIDYTPIENNEDKKNTKK